MVARTNSFAPSYAIRSPGVEDDRLRPTCDSDGRDEATPKRALRFRADQSKMRRSSRHDPAIIIFLSVHREVNRITHARVWPSFVAECWVAWPRGKCCGYSKWAWAWPCSCVTNGCRRTHAHAPCLSSADTSTWAWAWHPMPLHCEPINWRPPQKMATPQAPPGAPTRQDGGFSPRRRRACSRCARIRGRCGRRGVSWLCPWRSAQPAPVPRRPAGPMPSRPRRQTS